MKIVFNILAAVALILGILFKMEHWPGANVLLVSSSAFMLMLLWLVGFKGSTDKGSSTIMALLVTGGLTFFILGTLFRVMHWPYADILGWICTVFLLVIILVSLFGSIKGEDRLSNTFSNAHILTLLLVLLAVSTLSTIKKVETNCEKGGKDSCCEKTEMSSDTSKIK